MTGRAGFARLLADPPGAAVLAVCAGILGLRRAEAWSNPQFWAEDGHFYERAYVIGWRALALPYNGYLHTVPRLVAALAVRLDPALAPAFFVGCATLLTLYVASRALSVRCPLPRFAGCCALAVALVPNTGEVLLNIVNIQWVLAGALVLLLLSGDPEGPGQWAHDAISAAAIGLTGPFCIILAPLFAWRAWHRRTRASAILCATVVLCAVIQGRLVATLPSGVDGSPGDPVLAGLMLPAVARSVGCSLLLGSLTPAGLSQAAGTILGAATLLGAAGLASMGGALRRERAVLGIVFAAALAGSLYRTRHSLPQYFQPHSMSRYVYVPQLAAIWLLLSSAARGGRAGRVAAALAVLGFLANVPRYREPAYEDMHWGRYAPLIRAGEAVTVPINPPGWTMPLPARGK
jgi:hypothetical protein